MGQGTSKNAGQSSRGGVESHSSGRGSNTKRITRLRKLLQLRIPGLSRGKEKHRPPASYYHKDVSTSLASSLELVHRAAVSRPSSFQPLHPSEYDWTMDDIDTHTFDENEYSLHEETDNMMEMDPINNFFTIPPKNDIGPQRTSRKYRDDTLFPRYPERTPAARRKMNFERFKQLHAHAPPDTEYYLFLGITTVATTSIDRLGEAKGKISPDRTTISLGVAEILQESSVILTDAHVPHGPVSASVDRSRTPELTPPRLSPVPEEETPVPPGNQPSPSPIIIPEAFTSATLFQPNDDVVVETIGPSIHAFECSQIVSSIAAPYLRFARSRSTTSKKNMRSTWQKVTYLLTPNEPPSRSTNDEEYLSVKHLLALTRQAYPFNIVLYLKRLAIQWHLHDLARQYFDPDMLLKPEQNCPNVSVRIDTLPTKRYVVKSFYGAIHATTSYAMPANRPLSEYIAIVTLLGALLRRLFRYVKSRNPSFGVVSSSIGLAVGTTPASQRSLARIGFSLSGTQTKRNTLIREREKNLPELSSVRRKAFWESGNCAESETFSHLRGMNQTLSQPDESAMFLSLTLSLTKGGAGGSGELDLRGKQMCSLCHGLGKCLSDAISCSILDICPFG